MTMINAFQGEEHLSFVYEGHGTHAALLVHGFPGSAKEMRPVAQLLNAHGWTTEGVLLPGFGPQIEQLEQKTAQDWAAHVNTALQTLRERHRIVILLGNSMGGALSIQAAAKHNADGMILFAPFWTIDNFLWRALPVLKFVIPRFKPFQVFKPDFDDPEFQKGTRNFFPDADFNDPEFQRQTLQFEVNTRIFDQIRAAGMMGYDHAPQITVPTLVIQGNDDELVKPEITQKLLSRLNGDVIYTEVNAPHNPLDPEQDSWPEVVRAVEDYAKRFEMEVSS